MIYLTVKGDSASAEISSYGPFNEKGVLQNAWAAGLEPRQPGWLTESARLGSSKPEACVTASGDAAIAQAISPDKLSKVKVVFRGG